MASLDLLYARSEAAAARPITRIVVADRRGDNLWAEYNDRFGNPRKLPIDASGAEVAQEALSLSTTPSFWTWLYRFHDSLVVGKAGERLVGLSGLLLLSAVAIGLRLGWPARRAWRTAFHVGLWRSLNQRLYGWHRAVGLLAGSIALMTVPCGIYLAFSHDLRPVIGRLVPYQLPYKAPSNAELPSRRVTPEFALRQARQHFPAAAFVSITMPSRQMPAYVVRLRQADELRLWSGTTTVVIDAASGRTLHVYDAVRAPLSNRMADAAFSIHNGEVGGYVGRSLALLTGLSMPTLFSLGLWMWWRRRKRKAAPRAISPGS